MKTILSAAAAASIAALGLGHAGPAEAAVTSVVLVHGAFADGSGWRPVADILRGHGYAVSMVQEPETTFDADVAATRRALNHAGPCVLVAHSYGGMVITEVGSHPGVKALVYIAAFQPDVGESAGALEAKMPPAGKSIGTVGGGFLQVDPKAFHADFAADLPKATADFMADSQVQISTEAFGAKATDVAWKSKPTYAVVATRDRMINPNLERFMARRARSTVIELPGNHAIFLSQPKAVAALIEKAARAAN